jgi:hypothetical protein
MNPVRVRLLLSWLMILLFCVFILRGSMIGALVGWLIVFPAIILIRIGVPRPFRSKIEAVFGGAVILVLLAIWMNRTQLFPSWVVQTAKISYWVIVIPVFSYGVYREFIVYKNARQATSTEQNEAPKP